MKNVMLCGDFHCGHHVGLTPPSYNHKPDEDKNDPKWTLYVARKKLWDIFAREVKARPRPDVMVANGDLIDGRGERSGCTELLTSDRDEQSEMAAAVIRSVKPKKLVMTYGTPYHTGSNGEDFESVIKKAINVDPLGNPYKNRVDVTLKAHAYFKIGGVTFDCKHKIGASQIPHGRATALMRENLWSSVWNEYKDVPRADVFIRSHVHYHVFCGDTKKLMMTLPALQAQGSKYGARQCSGIVDWGFVWFECDKGEYSWEAVIPDDAVKAQKVELLEL